eukprot:9365268-Pyramimonas_sp.AAC.1
MKSTPFPARSRRHSRVAWGPATWEVSEAEFNEVPSGLLHPGSWGNVVAGKVPLGSSILELEGEALLLALRH